MKLLEGAFPPGSAVTVDFDGGAFTFTAGAPAKKAGKAKRSEEVSTG
jgi:hypothetical protein